MKRRNFFPVRVRQRLGGDDFYEWLCYSRKDLEELKKRDGITVYFGRKGWRPVVVVVRRVKSRLSTNVGRRGKPPTKRNTRKFRR